MQITSDAQALPWAPVSPGYSFKALHTAPDASEWVLMMRFEPGTIVPRHRHLGPTHVFNVAGHRKLDTGEIIGPGGYVLELPGNIDSWSVVGTEPLILFVTVNGEVHYVDENDQVIRRTSAATSLEAYRAYLAA